MLAKHWLHKKKDIGITDTSDTADVTIDEIDNIYPGKPSDIPMDTYDEAAKPSDTSDKIAYEDYPF